MPTTTLVPPRPAASAASPSPGARRGTAEMLATLYADHASDLRRFAARLTGDHGRAEDIVQETMLRAWRHPERVAGRTGTPRAWLYTVARHLAIDQHRARRARPAEAVGLTVLASRAAPDQIDAAITKWDLASALAGLRPRDRDLLTARYLRDRSIDEIAADQNIPAGTIKSRLSAARDALRRNLQSGNGSPGPRQEKENDDAKNPVTVRGLAQVTLDGTHIHLPVSWDQTLPGRIVHRRLRSMHPHLVGYLIAAAERSVRQSRP